MKKDRIREYIRKVLENVPSDWLDLTTHRLDIYHEELAKTEFIQEFGKLFEKDIADRDALSNLPTAYDYIRLGHPLSSVLEWAIAGVNDVSSDYVIGFSSNTMPIMAVLRKNLFDKKETRILYTEKLPEAFDEATVKEFYGYSFTSKKIDALAEIDDFDGSTVMVMPTSTLGEIEFNDKVDFYVNLYGELGSLLAINGEENLDYVSAIQHVRRRETIAMTPANCFRALKDFVGQNPDQLREEELTRSKSVVEDTIKQITATDSKPLLGSSGLSVQYGIMMGLIEDAKRHHPEKPIKFLVPPNCYGGTNDQARRVAACLDSVEIVDLPVDRENDMVDSLDRVLNEVAETNAVPYIIAEIPTNPRVEVPDLEALQAVLKKKRKSASGEEAILPVFILDQTFCPNVQFLKKGGIFSAVKAISYVSGSKFPSGGKCTAGYLTANEEAAGFMEVIEKHLALCDNEALPLQIEILAEQLPTMNQRIREAYANTRQFVDFIEETLPEAKINFVSEELADRGFTPSVFSLDLPTKGDTAEEREAHKRKLNHRLIDMMITQIPNDSKYCVSYGQLKGCYWTIPATSTQGTTKESDKDYIARVSVSPDLDLEKHKEVFLEFVKTL